MSASVIRCVAVSIGCLIVGLPFGATASESIVLLAEKGWSDFAQASSLGSLAWAGEDEGFSRATSSALRWKGPELAQDDASEVDLALVTGLAAPEPPGLLLAGLAVGGVLCGRSLVVRRQKFVGQTGFESETSRS